MERAIDALLERNRLQLENDMQSAGHDLWPAQKRLGEAIAPLAKERGLIRLAVECDAQVAELRNRLDDWENYGGVGTDRLARARRMRPDVLELMARRNAAAERMGYADYPAAVLASDGMTEAFLGEQLEAFLECRLAGLAHRARSEKVAMENWFRWLYDRYPLERPMEPLPLLSAFARKLGMEGVLERLELSQEPGFGCAGMISPTRIRLQTEEIVDVRSWHTLFHEFGHACLYALLPEGRLPWLSQGVDEWIAVLFENAGIHMMGDERLRAHALETVRADYARAAVSARFELALWRNMAQPEALYEAHYAALGVRVSPEEWALDSFRSIDCMVIGAYALGQRLADELPTQVDWPEVLRVAVRAAANGAGIMDLYEQVRKAGDIQ